MNEDIEIAEKLAVSGTLSNASLEKIKEANNNQLFSIGFEVRTLLYLGLLLFCSGLGVLIYKNIDTIGHLAVIIFIAAISFTCLGYCFLKRQPYSHEKVVSQKLLNDYILLLGCLTFATLTGYLQYQYSVFGSHNEVSFLLPAMLFFAIAYMFDHLGVLSMAITCLAAFVGITITPIELLQRNDFRSEDIILSGIALGVLLSAAAIILSNRNIKKHFKFTYLNFATHLLFVSCLAGMIILHIWVVYTLLLALFLTLNYLNAVKDKSFYFLLFTVLYGYVGLTDLIFRGLVKIMSIGAIYLGFFYFIGSSVFIILFLIRSGRKFKQNARI